MQEWQTHRGLSDGEHEAHGGDTDPDDPPPDSRLLTSGADSDAMVCGSGFCQRLLCCFTYFSLPQPGCHIQDSLSISNNQPEKMIENEIPVTGATKSTTNLGISPTEDCPKALGDFLV